MVNFRPLAFLALPVLFVLASCSSLTTGSGGSHSLLWIPPLLEGTATPTGTEFNLSVPATSKSFLSGKETATYSYNGAGFWGPTLVFNKGDKVTIHVNNNLSEQSTTHWHGLHVPAAMDGGPMQVVEPGALWSPTFTVMNQAATFWYHPHLHTTTAKQLALGAGGFLLVRDADEAKLALPRTYGVDDLPVVLTSRTFDASNQIQTDTIYGDRLLANGTLNAEATVGAQVVRLRLLNAEIERAYSLGFADNRTFFVIGGDGGLLEKPVPVTRLLMSPGERYEVLIDLTKDAVGSSVPLQAYNGGQAFGFPGGEPNKTGGFGSLLNNTTFEVLNLKVEAAGGEALLTIPTTLITNNYPTAAEVSNSRTINITDQGPGTPFTFDNAGYDMMMINQTVKLGATEKWSVVNDFVFGHSFHIHDVQFKLVSRSSGPVGAWESGWKDTFFIQRNETVSFIARFEDFADPVNAFMYHCHMANHEDGGLMGQFVVVP